MTTIEQKVLKITIKQLISLVVGICTILAALVARDVKRENQVMDLIEKYKAVNVGLEAAEKEREAMKVESNNKSNRITKIETQIEFLMQKNSEK